MNAPVSRRRLLAQLSGALMGLLTLAAGLPAIGFLLSPLRRRSGEAQWVSLGLLEEFAGAIGPVRADFDYEARSGYRIQTVSNSVWVVAGNGNGQVPRVFSKTCTHLACNVSWKDDQQLFVCPCHGGKFGRDGAVVAGPPPEPLTVIESRVEEGELQIRLG